MKHRIPFALLVLAVIGIASPDLSSVASVAPATTKPTTAPTPMTVRVKAGNSYAKVIGSGAPELAVPINLPQPMRAFLEGRAGVGIAADFEMEAIVADSQKLRVGCQGAAGEKWEVLGKPVVDWAVEYVERTNLREGNSYKVEGEIRFTIRHQTLIIFPCRVLASIDSGDVLTGAEIIWSRPEVWTRTD